MKSALLGVLFVVASTACRSSSSSSAGQDPVAPPIRLEIEGNETFEDVALRQVLQAEIGDLSQRGSPKAAVDDAAFSLELYYREQGFPACAVEYRLVDAGASGFEATLIVAEGTRVRIRRVRLAGNASMDSRELSLFFQPTPEALGSDAPHWFSARRVRDGLSGLQSFYRSRGFLDARVAMVVPRPDETEWKPEVELEIRVEEGPRWFLREITLEGGLDEVDRGLSRGEFVGQPLTPRTAGTLRGLLREIYGRAGYPDAEVEVLTEETGRPGDARLRLRVVPGPLVHIAGIEVAGNARTGERRMIDALALAPGDRYDIEKERESQRNLYRLGVFSSVGLALVGEGEERRLRVEVAEREAREIYVEPGYGSYEGLRLGFGWRELNLSGTARRLEIDGHVSALAQHGAISLTDPRIFESDFVASIALFGDSREEPSFSSTTFGTRVGFTREISAELDLMAGYELSKSRLDSSDIVEGELPDAQDDVDISSVSFSARWHTLDSVPLPTQGVLVRPSLEWSDAVLGSELDYLRFRWTMAWYERLARRAVLALSWRGGIIAPYGSTEEIPLQERFFNGGESTVRSFAEDQLGPKDAEQNPIGGEAYNVFTVEVRRELFGHVEGAVFVDAGNLMENVNDFLLFGELRYAIGAGVRYLLPVGPLRFDVGVNPNPREEEADYTAHFTVGFSF